MYKNVVKNQYVGKSKIDFTIDGKALSGTNLIGDLALLLADNDGTPYTNLDPHLPDYYIVGKVTDVSTMELDINDMETSFLFITGIPKKIPLDRFRLKNTTWSSYYEDRYRGYLFQMVKSGKPIELMNPISETIKINLIQQ